MIMKRFKNLYAGQFIVLFIAIAVACGWFGR
jgi:hypothetical protein